MKHMLSIAAMTLLISVGTATAQQGSNIHDAHLDHLDRNDNGAVSQSEYQSFMTSAFTRLDANGDGYLVQSEVSSMLSPSQFGSTDANGDGNVSQQEFLSQVMRDFQTADRSGDGQLR